MIHLTSKMLLLCLAVLALTNRCRLAAKFAGAGTWQRHADDWVWNYAQSTGVDYIALHVYLINSLNPRGRFSSTGHAYGRMIRGNPAGTK